MASIPDTNAMESYRQQMLEMYRKAVSTSVPVVAEDNWLDARYPEPNIEQDKAMLTTSEPLSETPLATPAYVGYLRVYVFTGGGAEPIPDAQVIVTRVDDTEQTVYANLTTDRDGFTPVIDLPSVDPALTLRPGTAQPYTPYTIRIIAEGFQPVEHRTIPVYGNNYVTQPVAMIPILPGQSTDNTQEYTSGGPDNL